MFSDKLLKCFRYVITKSVYVNDVDDYSLHKFMHNNLYNATFSKNIFKFLQCTEKDSGKFKLGFVVDFIIFITVFKWLGNAIQNIMIYNEQIG